MFQSKYLKYKAKYLELQNSKKKVEQKGGSKKNITTWGGQSPSDENKAPTNSNKQINKWD